MTGVASPVATTSRVAPAAVAAAAAASCAVLAVVDPNEPGSYGRCPFLLLTGRWCPGCGSLRGLNALLRGDVAAAVGFNVLMVLAVPYLLYSWAAWASASWSRRPLPALRPPAAAIWSLLGVIVVFWAVRNIPAAPFSALAP